MKNIVSTLLALSLAGSYANGSVVKVERFLNQNYVVFEPKSLEQLSLKLTDSKGKNLGGFAAWQKQLDTCESLFFAMNAGMYHPNYQPVGLYIENSKIYNHLNQEEGFGNFFMKPNGVVGWNAKQAIISQTQDWEKQKFNATYATQSGPMLVIDGKIMHQFIPNSDSKKIRNGVGIKDGKLFFVISQKRVNFYEFAEFFQKGLGAEQALYLDGSISSIYAPAIKRHDRAYQLGPMLGYIESQPKCD